MASCHRNDLCRVSLLKVGRRWARLDLGSASAQYSDCQAIQAKSPPEFTVLELNGRPRKPIQKQRVLKQLMSKKSKQRASGPVWVSSAIEDSTLVKPFTSDLHETEPARLVEAFKRWHRAEPFGRDAAPRELYAEYGDRTIGSVPDFFEGSGYWIASERVTDVFQNFDMGKTRFFEIAIFEHDRSTRIGERFFIVSFGETKETVVPSDSPTLNRERYTNDVKWTLPSTLARDELAFLPSASLGVDLWMDPAVSRAIFMSDQLVAALKRAGLIDGMRLTRCRCANLS